MSKQVNDNIGHIVCGCHGCQELAALRRDRNGKFYHDCLDCGRIAPNMEGGQQRIMDTAVIWGPEGAPDDVPRWIGEQWPWGKSRRMIQEAREPMNAEPKAAPTMEQPAQPRVTGNRTADPLRDSQPLPVEPRTPAAPPKKDIHPKPRDQEPRQDESGPFLWG